MSEEKELSYFDFGEMALKECDDANIPVQSFISSPEESGDEYWHWTAANFMPRKLIAHDGAYEIRAKSREEIIKALEKYVIPLYQNAIDSLRIKGSSYYWSEPKVTTLPRRER